MFFFSERAAALLGLLTRQQVCVVPFFNPKKCTEMNCMVRGKENSWILGNVPFCTNLIFIFIFIFTTLLGVLLWGNLIFFSCAAWLTVHALLKKKVFIIHWTLTCSTGSLTCVCDLFACIYTCSASPAWTTKLTTGAGARSTSCRPTWTSSGNCQATEFRMVWACYVPWQPLWNHPSERLGGWATLWSTEKMLDSQCQRVNLPAHARTAYNLLQKKNPTGSEDDLYRIVHLSPPTT